MRNLKLWIAYDGTNYQGWQKQNRTKKTIQGRMEYVLEQILKEEVNIIASGRTDAGVHAKMQIANVHIQSEIKLEELKKELAKQLPKDIAVYHVDEVEERFHARYCAKKKTYCYRILNRDYPDVFQRQYQCLIEEKLDVEAMKQASQYLLGEHDFRCFCANKRMKKSTIRRIYDISFKNENDEIVISYTGNGFLYNMVRIMTGTLIEVGKGKMKPEEMKEVLFSRDRTQAGPTAPANGLMLMNVEY